jgi:hypothetical protein
MNDSGLAVVGGDGGAAVVVVAGSLADDEACETDGRLSLVHAPARTSTAVATTQRCIAESWQRYLARVVQRTATCVWRATPAVIVALDERFGEPVDAYVNGSQTWLRDDGPGGVTLEWRLHPVAGYRKPDDIDTYEVFTSVALAIETGQEPPAPIEQLWEGLEAYAAYDDEIEPVPLAAAAEQALGI